MVKVSGTASYDCDTKKALHNTMTSSTDFQKITAFSKNSAKPKFVATSYVSRKPGD